MTPRHSMRKTFISLRNRNYRLFFIGQSISNTGNWLTNVALTLLVLRLTGSGTAVGFLAACQYGPILLLSAWGGAVADRSDKRRLLYVTQGLEMAQSVALAVLAFLPHPSLIPIYLVALAGGCMLAVDNPLRRSFVTEMVVQEDIPNAVVLYSMVINLSRIFGPALAGLLVTTLGYGWCFTLDAVSYIAVLASLAMMRPEELRRTPPHPRRRGDIQEGLRYLRTVPELFISYGMLAAIGLLAYNFNVTLPLFVTQSLHGSDAAFTTIYSVLSFGSLMAALLVAQRSSISLWHVIVGAAAMGTGMLVFSATPNVWAAGAVAFFVGAASILYTTSTTAIVQVRAKQEMHGRMLALQTIFMIGSSALGGPLSGWVADLVGARWLIALGGIVCMAAAIFGWLSHRQDQMPASST